MCNFETEMLVYEAKGLLRGLEINIGNAEYKLSVDNYNFLYQELFRMREIIDKIEEKIDKCTKDLDD